MASGTYINCYREENRSRTYYNGLNEDAKRRYVEKLDSVSSEMNDPYTFPPNMIPADSFPDLQFFNYLVNTPNVYTKDDLKAYKSLDAYKYLLAGSYHRRQSAENSSFVQKFVTHNQ